VPEPPGQEGRRDVSPSVRTGRSGPGGGGGVRELPARWAPERRGDLIPVVLEMDTGGRGRC